MKEKMVQLLMCPGQDNGSAACEGCCVKGKSECFKALKAEVLNSLQGEVAVHRPFSLEKRVTEVFREIGVPAHIKGYNYLREAVVVAVRNMNVINAITSELYPAVAEKFDTTPSRVERAIRHAIEVAWDRGDIEVLQQYFGNTTSSMKGKPTNSEFIALIADNLCMEVKQNG